MKPLEIIIVAVLAMFVAATGIKWQRADWTAKTGAVLAIVVASLICYNGIKEWKEKESKKTDEELEKRIKAVFGDVSDLSEDSQPQVEIGYSGTIFHFMGTGPLITIESTPVVKLTLKQGKLHVTSVIRDNGGKLIATLIDNEWEMVNQEYDYNNDETAFEVVTKGDRRIMLSVELKDGRAHLMGEFYSENGFGMTIYPAAQGGAMIARVLPGHPAIHVPNEVAKPIFKYPRSRYLGQRANQ